MNGGLGEWQGKEVRDKHSGVCGILSVRSGKSDIVMDEGGMIHSDEVVISGNGSQLYLGSARVFNNNYIISDEGTASRRVVG